MKLLHAMFMLFTFIGGAMFVTATAIVVDYAITQNHELSVITFVFEFSVILCTGFGYVSLMEKLETCLFKNQSTA